MDLKLTKLLIIVHPKNNDKINSNINKSSKFLNMKMLNK